MQDWYVHTAITEYLKIGTSPNFLTNLNQELSQISREHQDLPGEESQMQKWKTP
jgi:hypothetical protein